MIERKFYVIARNFPESDEIQYVYEIDGGHIYTCDEDSSYFGSVLKFEEDELELAKSLAKHCERYNGNRNYLIVKIETVKTILEDDKDENK